MPYIKNRERFNKFLCDFSDLGPLCAGDLNYLISSFVDIEARGGNYARLNEMIGCLECAKLEIYRRMIAPYEDVKAAENGDVFNREEAKPTKGPDQKALLTSEEFLTRAEFLNAPGGMLTREMLHEINLNLMKYGNVLNTGPIETKIGPIKGPDRNERYDAPGFRVTDEQVENIHNPKVQSQILRDWSEAQKQKK